MTIDERIGALTMNLELMGLRLETLAKQSEVDAENIRGLARIAEIDENGRHSGNHWLRIRKRADGTIWVRIPQCFGYEVAA